jgi:DNA-3-methyladenine glycosylase II
VACNPHPGITRRTFAQGLIYLSARDSDLAQVLSQIGAPPLWSRQPGFPTLVHIILEQQVSLASARAAFHRLSMAVSPLSPEGFLELSDGSLKIMGFSRQKISYTRGLAERIVQGNLNLHALRGMGDADARSALRRVKGIGPWSADIYLLMALRRPDVWPSGDLALAAAVEGVKGLSFRPSPDQLEEIGQKWRPWRAVAARVLWHYYLNGGPVA